MGKGATCSGKESNRQWDEVVRSDDIVQNLMYPIPRALFTVQVVCAQKSLVTPIMVLCCTHQKRCAVRSIVSDSGIAVDAVHHVHMHSHRLRDSRVEIVFARFLEVKFGGACRKQG